MSEKRPTKRRRYDAEFKANALKLLEDGRSVSSVSKSLGVKESLLYTWRSKSKKTKQKTASGALSLEQEVKQLKKQLREVEQERDILKKALSIFSRQT
jgi:transposase